MKRDNPFVAGNPASTSDLIATIEEMQKEIEKLKQSQTTHPNLDNVHGIICSEIAIYPILSQQKFLVN